VKILRGYFYFFYFCRNQKNNLQFPKNYKISHNMTNKLFKLFPYVLLSILFFAHPLSISATVYQKKVTQIAEPTFEKKTKTKQGFVQKLIQRFIQKRIEKVLKKQAKRDFEQEQPNQTVGIIAFLMMFIGFVVLLAMSGIGFLLIFGALILSIIGLITEEKPIYSRRTFWISLVITIYFLARRKQ
jgi:hypothetical protein